MFTHMESVQKILAEIGAQRVLEHARHPNLSSVEDSYSHNQLAEAAAAYALGNPEIITQTGPRTSHHYLLYPFRPDTWDALSNRREQLVKAAMFAIAEIERLDRITAAEESAAKRGQELPPGFHAAADHIPHDEIIMTEEASDAAIDLAASFKNFEEEEPAKSKSDDPPPPSRPTAKVGDSPTSFPRVIATRGGFETKLHRTSPAPNNNNRGLRKIFTPDRTKDNSLWRKVKISYNELISTPFSAMF